MKAVVIAGTRSGAGKTSVALGVMAALRRRGLVVQPFKVGPDFIDPGHHELAAGRVSHNLDGWMCGRSMVEEIFARYAHDADVAVIEGVMGVFDGFSGTSEDGSTAQIAKWLGAPALLVADASSMARSAAAMIKGYAEFDPDLPLAGVLFNRIGSIGHRQLVTEAVEQLGTVKLAGFLGRDEDISMPSRHLGLVTAQETEFDEHVAGRLADWVEQGLDLDDLLASLPEMERTAVPQMVEVSTPVRLAIAEDEAFCFYYAENLRQLQAAGAQLVPFSPIRDKSLPENIAGVYLGGGYPELYAFDLSNNTAMRKNLKRFIESGGPVYAECGGFMYLMHSVTNQHGQGCQMTGIFPFKASLGKRFRALGYRHVETGRDSILGPAGTIACGHEFHYSVIDPSSYEGDVIYSVEDRRGPRSEPEGFVHRNTLGSYIHLHFGSNPILARNMVAFCAKWMAENPA